MKSGLTREVYSEDSVLGHIVTVSNEAVVGQFVQRNADIPVPGIKVGDVVKIQTGESTVYGMINECSSTTPDISAGSSRYIYYKIDLLGETSKSATGNFRFKRGVSVYPSIDQSILPATSDDFHEIYTMPYRSSVKIGTLHQNEHVPVSVDINDLIGKHFAILGSTGSGKSCSLAVLLNAILARYPSGHVILVDLHDEYKTAFSGMVEYFDVSSIDLPYWLLNFNELARVLCQGDAAQFEAQSNILFKCVFTAKNDFIRSTGAKTPVTVDSPSPYRLGRLQELLREEMGRLDKPGNSLAYLAILSRIDQLKSDKRYGFMFSDMVVRDVFADIISRILRIPVDGKPITILNLSGTPSEIMNVVVSLIARLVFDFAVLNHDRNSTPVLLVCEEAHQYIPKEGEANIMPAGRAISRIAKEGRKYGVGLAIVTQRPSEISEEILSQCNTLFCLRLTTSADQEFVTNALPDNCLGMFKMLSSLRTRDAIVIGEAIPAPMRIRVDLLPGERMPRRPALPISDLWETDRTDASTVSDVISRWRGVAP